MTDQDTRYTFDRVVRMTISAGTFIALLALLRYLSDVLLPFAAAVVLAYLLNPLVTLFEQKTKRRGFAVALTLGGLGVVGLALVVILVPLMIGQVRHVGEALDKLREDLALAVDADAGPTDAAPETLSEPATSASTTAPAKSAVGWRELKRGWAQYRSEAGTLLRAERLANLRDAVAGTYIGDLLERTVQYTETEEFNRLVVDAAKRVAVGGWTVVSLAVNLVLAVTGLIVVLLYLVFLLLDYPEYARTWATFLPPQYRRTIVEFWEQFETALRRYFRGQSIVALLVGTLFAVGFTLIGLPMAVPFGLFVGLLNMVPYLQAVGLVPGVLLAGLQAVEGDSSFLVSVLLVLLVFGVVQVIQDAVITPRIMGQATGLQPLAILLGIFIWAKLLGFLGLLLAIPLTCLGIAYYRRFVLRHGPQTVAPAGDAQVDSLSR
jgi:predicted PurR-regulated permease PerM